MAEVKLGPDEADKIAIVGSSASSTLLAPFDDKTWAIWGTSPSTWAQFNGRRADVWFELHRWLPYEPAQANAPGVRPWFSPEFRQFLREFKGHAVFMTELHPDIPKCVQFPYKMLLEKHGPYHFTSSVAWMLAMAIEQMPKAIGMFGIDMAAGSEWAYQRPACQHFIGLAKQLGIEVILPPESDLMRPTTMYGIGEHNLRHIRLAERIKECEQRKQALQQQAQAATFGLQQIEGELLAYNYMLDCWTDDIVPDGRDAMSFSGVFAKSKPAEPVGGYISATDYPHPSGQGSVTVVADA